MKEEIKIPASENHSSDIILCLFAIFVCLLVLAMIFTDDEMKECAAVPAAVLSLSIVIALYNLIKKIAVRKL